MSKIVDRTLDFLELFADQKRPLSLSEIARLLGIPVSSCHDVLQALVRRGYLYEVAARAGFYPTARLLKVAETIADNDPVQARAEAVIEQLSESLGETVALAKATRLDLTYVMVRESDHQLRFSVQEGDHVRSYHATSAGKCLLASLAPEQLEEVLQTIDLQSLTPNTITDKASLRADLEAGRKRGWYLNDEESALDALTMSSAFRWRDAFYVLTVAGPKTRVARKRDEVVKRLLESCRQLDAEA